MCAPRQEVRIPVAVVTFVSSYVGTGIGAYKLGANYAAGVAAQKFASAKGYVQNLWLQGPEHYITEVGTMNAFVVFKRAGGGTSPSLKLLRSR